MAPAASAKGPTGGNLTASGTITVTWRGDAARGCAAAGMCDVSGRLVVPVDARGRAFVSDRGRGGPRVAYAYAFDDRSAGVVRVSRGGDATCVDAPAGPAFGPGGVGIQFGPSGSRGTVARFQGGSVLSAGRCAGPVGADLAAALPQADVRIADLERSSTRVDLGGRRAFAAGVFSGEIVSNVVVAVERLEAPRRSAPRRAGGVPALPRRYRRVVRTHRSLTVTYRVAAVRGAIRSPFAGLGAPDCSVLDACGVRGETTLQPEPGARFTLRGRLRTRARTVAQALRAVRAGRERLGTSYGQPAPARVAGETTRDGSAAVCRDAPGRGGIRLQTASRTSTAMAVRLRATSIQPSLSTLRSRCPGPGIAAESIIAAGELPVSRLGARTIAVRLRASGIDAAPGYATLPRTGEVAVELRAVGARIVTVRRVRMVRR